MHQKTLVSVFLLDWDSQNIWEACSSAADDPEPPGLSEEAGW